jgi:hypothetical protein
MGRVAAIGGIRLGFSHFSHRKCKSRIGGVMRLLRAFLPPTLTIVTLAESFGILDDFEAGRRL